MKLIKILCGMLVFGFTSILSAAPIDTTIDIRNTYASYVNNGICSIAFNLTAHDSLDNVKKIDISVIMKNKKGKLIDKDLITVDEFERVGFKAYSTFFIESESACDAFGEILYIPKAILYYNDGTKAEDIVKNKKLAIDDFEPMKIVISPMK